MSKYSLKILIFLFLISIFTYGIKRPAYGFELTNDFTAKYIHNTKNESSILYSEDSYVANAAYLFLNPKLEIADDTIRVFFDSEINYINPKWNQEQNTKKESSQYKINELYGQVYLSDFVLLRAGKQVLKWGTGYFYNPIDFFNPKKELVERESPSVEGVTLVKLNVITQNLSITLAAIPDNIFEEHRSGAQISTSSLIPYTDLYLAGYYSKHEKLKLGGAFSSNPFAQKAFLDGLLIWSEASFYSRSERYGLETRSIVNPGTGQTYRYYYSNELPEKTHWSYTGGMSFEFPGTGTILMGEYYYIGDGYSEEDYKKLSKNIIDTRNYRESADLFEQAVFGLNMMWVPEMTRFAKNNRQYLAFGVQQTSITSSSNILTDTLGFGINTILNLEDHSYLLMGSLSSSIIENSLIGFNVAWAHGSDYTEFNNLPYKLKLDLCFSISF